MKQNWGVLLPGIFWAKEKKNAKSYSFELQCKWCLGVWDVARLFLQQRQPEKESKNVKNAKILSKRISRQIATN